MISYKFQNLRYIESEGNPKSKTIHSSMRSVADYKCTDEEWSFFEKYGRDCFYNWRRMNIDERRELNDVIELYQSFWELYYNHYEDLCLYSIMYRNVNILSPAMNDILSVLYFVSKRDEIVGFKKKLNKSRSLNAKVALLYSSNIYLFNQIFSKYVKEGIDIIDRGRNLNYEMPKLRNFENTFNQFRKKNITESKGINNLSKNDCLTILQHVDELDNEYKKVYDDTLKKYIVKLKGIRFSNIFFNKQFRTIYGRLRYPFTTEFNRYKVKGEEENLFNFFNKASLIPALKEESRNAILSRNEIRIVDFWCRHMRNIIETRENEERERIRLIREKELEKARLKEELIRKEEEARKEKFKYNKNNRHYRDSYISFDEATHLYKVNGEILQSVTNFVDGCFPKFNAEFFAKKKAAYMGISTQEVLDMWEQKGKESRELGTELHKKIENYYQDIASTEDDTFKLFLTFANKVELKPYRTEWAVYDFKHKIAGTIDFVDYQNGEYIIYDWKRSEKIIENGMPVKISKYDEKGNHPLEHLDNTPYYHYALQLSLYKYILEKNYGMKISDLRLGIFHPAYNKPYVLRIPYLEKEINDIFSLRSEVLF